MEKKKIYYKDYIFKRHFILFLKKYSFLQYKKKKSKQFLVSLESLWSFSPFLAQNILKKPLFYIPIIEHYINKFYRNTKVKKKINFGFNLKNSIKKKFTSPRLLTAKFIGEIVFLQGLIVSCGKKKVRIIQSVYFCSESEKIFIKKTSQQFNKVLNFKKIKNKDGQFLELEYGLSNFIDCQNVIIQDFPETLNNDQSPSSITIILENDLVNSCKIGEKIKLCGIYQPLKLSGSNINSNLLSPSIKCLSISLVSKNSSFVYFKCDVLLMKNFSLLVDSFDRLSSLIAPSVYGQFLIKKGIILLLAGGNENYLKENVSILLVGDSCVHKTYFLKFLANFYSSAVFITLKGNFFNELNNGLKKNRSTNTNAFINLTKELSDDHLICIDGIEYISELDKYILTNFLDYQKNQTLTKNGISSFANKCGLIASANSIYGNYNRKKSIQTNLRLEKSFLSKFDLIFLVIDSIDIKKDRKHANNLIDNNNYFTEKKYNSVKKKIPKSFFEIEKFSIDFLKIFLKFCKKLCFPQLEDDAVSYILADYVKTKIFKIKNQDFKINYFETLIKLTLIYVKTNLRLTANKKDVEYINNYLLQITRNNQIDEFIDFSSINHSYMQDNYSNCNITPKNLIFQSKLDIIFLTSNKINILKKFASLPNITSIMDFKFSFYKAKKILFRKCKNSYFERTLSEWLKNEKCLVFKNFFLRI